MPVMFCRINDFEIEQNLKCSSTSQTSFSVKPFPVGWHSKWCLATASLGFTHVLPFPSSLVLKVVLAEWTLLRLAFWSHAVSYCLLATFCKAFSLYYFPPRSTLIRCYESYPEWAIPFWTPPAHHKFFLKINNSALISSCNVLFLTDWISHF